MKIISGFKGADNKWYISIKNSRNGKIVADGAEGYSSKSNVIRAINKNFGDGYVMEKISEDTVAVRFDMVPRSKVYQPEGTGGGYQPEEIQGDNPADNPPGKD